MKSLSSFTHRLVLFYKHICIFFKEYTVVHDFCSKNSPKSAKTHWNYVTGFPRLMSDSWGILMCTSVNVPLKKERRTWWGLNNDWILLCEPLTFSSISVYNKSNWCTSFELETIIANDLESKNIDFYTILPTKAPVTEL